MEANINLTPTTNHLEITDKECEILKGMLDIKITYDHEFHSEKRIDEFKRIYKKLTNIKSDNSESKKKEANKWLNSFQSVIENELNNPNHTSIEDYGKRILTYIELFREKNK